MGPSVSSSLTETDVAIMRKSLGKYVRNCYKQGGFKAEASGGK